MSTQKYEIVDVCLTDGRRGVTVGVENGCIGHVGPRRGWKQAFDGHGALALPGAIDGHVHSRTPGDYHEEQKEDWESLQLAALKGGVTAVCDMPNNIGEHAVVSRERFLRKVTRFERTARLAFKLFVGATAGQARLLNDSSVTDNEHFAGVKIYMEDTTGDLRLADAREQQEWCQRAADRNVLVVVHAGDQEMITKNRGKIAEPQVAQHCVIRSTEVELSGGFRILEIAEATGCRLHIAHVSTPELLSAIAVAKAKGVQVTCEVCPHHWCFDSRYLTGPRAGYYKMNPPLRSLEQVTELREHLISGTVDSVATDHAPHTRLEKERRQYDLIPSGVPGVQEMLLLLYQLVVARQMSLQRLVDLTAGAAARRFGWEKQKGKLEPGYEADIVLLDTQATTTFSARNVASKCGWTAYEGVSVKGAVRFVAADGKIMLNELKICREY